MDQAEIRRQVRRFAMLQEQRNEMYARMSELLERMRANSGVGMHPDMRAELEAICRANESLR